MSTNQQQAAAAQAQPDPTTDRRAADKKLAVTRVYVVRKEGKKRLVRAEHRNVAYGHVYGAAVDETVSVANQAELIALLTAGVLIEEPVAAIPAGASNGASNGAKP